MRFLYVCHPSATGILFFAVESSGKWWYILKIKFLPPFGFAKRWHKGCFSLYATARVNFGLFNSKLAKQMVVQGESLICLPPFSDKKSFFAVESSGKWWYILKIKFLPPFGFAKRWHKGCFSLYATARVNFGLFNSKLAKQMVVQGKILTIFPQWN